jgi:hypothetical protein
MSSSRPEPRAVKARVTREALAVELSDGRTLIVPIGWFPRLVHGTAAERNRWRLVGRGEGIHWPDLDEDISVKGLLAGTASGESAPSFQRWLEARRPRRRVGADLARERSPNGRRRR